MWRRSAVGGAAKHRTRLTGRLGNLIIGYNEQALAGPPLPREVRTGSHNLVVGDFHTYTSFGGFVAGNQNRVTHKHASVSGGTDNSASGAYSSVSGGHRNRASGIAASVSGGQESYAVDEFNWAAGELFEPN